MPIFAWRIHAIYYWQRKPPRPFFYFVRIFQMIQIKCLSMNLKICQGKTRDRQTINGVNGQHVSVTSFIFFFRHYQVAPDSMALLTYWLKAQAGLLLWTFSFWSATARRTVLTVNHDFEISLKSHTPALRSSCRILLFHAFRKS